MLEPLEELPLDPPLLAEPLGLLLGLEELLDPEEPIEEEPLAALPLFLLWFWFALEPAPALSRLQAVIPTAITAAAMTAVRVFRFMRASPLKWTG